MYTNDPIQRQLWTKTVNSNEATPSSVHLTPLRKSERSPAAHSSPVRTTASLPRSPAPPGSPATREDAGGGYRPARTTVMDPLAALRQCLQYVCSHPEVYGDDIRGLLDREVMHVVRLKASEVSLIQGQRPLLVEPLSSTSVRQSTRSVNHSGALPSISAHSGALQVTSSASAATPMDGGVPAGDLFGYGSVSFLPANSPGFSALLRESRAMGATGTVTGRLRMLDSVDDRALPPALPHMNAMPLLDEPIQWNGTLPPPSSSLSAADKAGPGSLGADSDGVAAAARAVLAEGGADSSATLPRGERLGNKAGGRVVLASPDYSLVDPYSAAEQQRAEEDARLFRQVDELGHTAPLASSRAALSAADGGAVVLDHQGYEVTYLRAQLQQLEAAFNAKCVRLHELESENKLLAAQMKESEEAAARWSAEHHAMEGKLEALRRELDGWKDRANDALSAATKQSKQRTQHAKQLASNQINDAKQEAARLSQLWRETERALQESRRAFENTEKEAAAAHNHLTDAFHYLERLERRVARRDAYVQLCERRQRSLEEKYEKLMWGFEELSAVEGRYSYVDYLLTSRPLWSVHLFAALAQRRGDYAALQDQGVLKRQLTLLAAPFLPTTTGEVASVGKPAGTLSGGGEAMTAAEAQAWLLFARTPQGGSYAGAHFDPALVARLMAEETTAEVRRRGRAKQLRTNVHGSVGCRVLRWGERFSIDYLGGQDSSPDGADLNRKFAPVLTLASLLLPLRSRSGAWMQDAAVAADAAAAVGKGTLARPTALTAVIPNTRRYDAATIRFVLRCFWKDRLGAFLRQMELAVHEAEAKEQLLRDAQDGVLHRVSDPSSVSNNESAGGQETRPATRSSDSGGDDDSAESRPAFPTFLSALVDFAGRFVTLPTGVASPPPGVASAAPSVAAESEKTAQLLLRVRGVLAQRSATKAGASVSKSASGTAAASASADTALWESGRIFFATVLQSPITAAAGATTAAARTAVAATAAAASGRGASAGGESDKAAETEVASLAEEVRELLTALYYYTMEYKTHDPDFRLFYLVSHQLIPEMVAVNFFASLESMQRHAAELLDKRIHALVQEEQDSGDESEDEQATAEVVTSTSALKIAVTEAEDPLSALTRTVKLMDDAPLDAEYDNMESDSEGEGYGSIIPYRAKKGPHDGAPIAIMPPPHAAEVAGVSEDDELSAAGSVTRKASDNASGASRRKRELALMHNIRHYIHHRRLSAERAAKKAAHSANSNNNSSSVAPPDSGNDADGEEERRSAATVSAAEGSPTAPGDGLSSFAFGDAPPEWSSLEARVLQSLAPHTGLLDAFRARWKPKGFSSLANITNASMASMASRSNMNLKGDRSFVQRKRDDRKARHVAAKRLCATRGLLPLADTLAMLQQHCFATYAVSCCGTPRFSLADALLKGKGAHPSSASAGVPSVDPFSVVGYLPPSGLHLQQLRFALALDQPSSLVNVARLFAVDAVTKSNSHLYDTYLSLTLDLFQQQQAFLMQSVLKSCAARHEKYALDGGEDCDGQIPIASLRTGMKKAMQSIRGSAQLATALVNHLVQYDHLLRLEDEVKLEQFADAPVLLNAPARHGRTMSTMNGTVRSSHANQGSFHSAATTAAVPPFHPRRSDVSAVVDEVEEAEFNFQEEAESCSLLHMAFAVRMTYVVWGSHCTDTAAALVHRVVQRPVPTTRPQPQDDLDGFGAAARESAQLAEAPEWDVFEQQVHERYTLSVERLREGHNGDDNPLRRTLRAECLRLHGLSHTTPYSSAPRTSRGKADAAATGPAGDTPAVAHSTDSSSVYPDMTHVFLAAASEAPPPPPAAPATSDAKGATARGGGAGGKQKSAAAAAAAASSRRSSAHSAGPQQRSSSGASPAGPQQPPPPDFGLISLARALGFVAPVVVASAANAAASGGAAGKKGAAKGTGKKPAAKKGSAAEPGKLATAVQEEYSRALNTQLETLAARIALSLASKEEEEQEDTREGGVNPDNDASASAAANAASAEPPRTITFPSVEGDATAAAPPAAAARNATRARSVAFVQETRNEAGTAAVRRSMANGPDGAGRTGPGAAAAGGGGGLGWHPVFAHEARELEKGHGGASSSTAVLDVSKLYAACAALSVL